MTLSKIENITAPFSRPLHGKICTGFFDRFKGLMFNRDLAENECIILDEGTESKLNTSIHMFFMFYDIAVIWADKNWKVVEIKVARKWKPYYASSEPARFVLEARTGWFQSFHKGDQLRISNV
jgi:uncharacterized membrane protein (UPF0127 family)